MNAQQGLMDDPAVDRWNIEDRASNESSRPSRVGDRSMLEDLKHLYRDGRNYAQAELAYQKSRASVVGKYGGKGAALGFAGFVVGLLAMIGLTIGLILTLATVIGPLAATLIVVIALLVAMAALLYMAKKEIDVARAAVRGQELDHD